MDPRGILEQLLRSGQSLANQGRDMAETKMGVPEAGSERDAMLSGMGKGALAAGALGLLFGTKSGRKVTGSAVKVGGLAALGGLAYKAYKDWQSTQSMEAQAAPSEPGTPVAELTGDQANRRSTALLRAMIAASKADGHIDADERARIEQQFRSLGLDADGERFFAEELERPADPAAIAREADTPEAAAEIYVTSLLAIDVDNYMERGYLDELARQLGLSKELAAKLEERVRSQA